MNIASSYSMCTTPKATHNWLTTTHTLSMRIESKDSSSAYIWKEDMKNIERRKLVWIPREIELLLLTDIVFIAQVTTYRCHIKKSLIV